jgi:hypothetical protein
MRPTKSLAAAVIVSSVALASGVASAVGASTSNRHARHHAHLADTSTGNAPAGLQTAFAALRRARISGDALPPYLGAIAANALQQSGADPSLSVLLTASPSNGLWFVPGASESCVLDSHGEFVCAPTSRAEQTGIVLVSNGVAVAGVLPDRSTPLTLTRNDGSSVDAAPNASGAVEATSAIPVTAVSGTGPGGGQIGFAVKAAPAPPPGDSSAG